MKNCWIALSPRRNSRVQRASSPSRPAPCVHHALGRDAQLRADIGGDLLGGGGGQGQHHRLAQPRQQVRDLQEGRPEVVPPLRDAMRLVHGQQAHRMRQQALQEGRVGQPLRRGHEDAHAAVGHRLFGGACFVAVDRAVHLHRRHAPGAQRFALVLHQRDQRRHDDGATRQQQRRQLVAQRLAGAGGHHRQRRLAP